MCWGKPCTKILLIYLQVSGYLNLAANVIDNFTHGLAVAGGFLVSIKVRNSVNDIIGRVNP